jgi:DNA recombination protein RmuC
MAQMSLVIGVIVLASFIVGLLLGKLLFRAPDTKTLEQQVGDLERRLEELQRTVATQQQVELIRSDLTTAQKSLTQADTRLQSLTEFTQRTFYPQVVEQLQNATKTLATLDQALNDAKRDLKSAGENITSVKTLVEEASNNLRSYQEQLINNLRELQRDLGIAKATVQEIAMQVNILTGLEKAVGRIEKDIDQLTRILLGRKSGVVGERLVEELLRPIPESWVERNVKVGDGEVEFAIKMPGNRFIPLDSKFVAPDLVAQLEGNGENEEKQKQLEKEVNRQMEQRLREVSKYLKDERMLGFAIAAVPDSVYSICRSAIKKSAERNIVVVPYTLLLPFVLSLYMMAQKLGISRIGDTEQAICTAKTALEEAKKELENMAKEVRAISNQREKALKGVEYAIRHISKLIEGETPIPEESETLVQSEGSE